MNSRTAARQPAEDLVLKVVGDQGLGADLPPAWPDRLAA